MKGRGLGCCYAGETPFSGPVMTQPGFMGSLCPMVKRLELSELEIVIDGPQFAAICELTRLEVLLISADNEPIWVCN